MGYVETLAAKGAECREQVEKLRAEIALLETKLKLIDELLALEHRRKPVSTVMETKTPKGGKPRRVREAAVAPRDETPVEGIADGVKRRSRERDGEGMTIRERMVAACVEAIRQAGTPLDRNDLLVVLTSKGLRPPTETPGPYLSSLLSRARDSLVPIAGEGYGLPEWKGASPQRAA